jgi:hypothetical protein
MPDWRIHKADTCRLSRFAELLAANRRIIALEVQKDPEAISVCIEESADQWNSNRMTDDRKEHPMIIDPDFESNLVDPKTLSCTLNREANTIPSALLNAQKISIQINSENYHEEIRQEIPRAR